MESLVITPNSKRQQTVLVSLFREMGIAFTSVPIERESPEEDRFYPVLQEKIDSAMERRDKGEAVRLDTSSFDDFVASIRSRG